MAAGLRTRFFLAFAGLTAILALLAGLLGVQLIHRAALREANASLALNLQAALSVLDTLRHEWSPLASTLGGGRRVAAACADPGSAASVAELEAIRRQVGFDIFLLTDLEGRVATRTTPPYRTGDTLTDAPVRAALQGATEAGFIVLAGGRLAAEGDDAVRRVAATSPGEGLALVVAAPALDSQGRQAGTLVAGVVVNDSPLLEQRLRSLTVAVGDASPAVVTSIYVSDTEVLTTRPSEMGLVPSRLPHLAEGANTAVPGGPNWYGTQEAEGTHMVVAAAPLVQVPGDKAAILAVAIPGERFAALRRSMGLWYGGVGLAGVLVAMAIGARLASRLTRPMTSLAGAADALSTGQFEVRLEEPRARDEVRALTVAFNRMAEGLSQRDAGLAAAREELERTNHSLMALNENYLNMLGFVSHELKNLLGTMTWSVQALAGGLTGPLSDSQARLVRSLRLALDGALAMTRNFLDLARIETGRLQLDFAPCDVVSDVIRPVLQELDADASGRAMSIEADLPERLSLTADASLLQVVVRNLLGNALRYGRKGGRVRVGCGIDGDGDTAWCEVWNEGEGLRPDQIAQLFGKFRRFSAGRPDAPRGSGLGLFIVREIVQRHGGTIAAESEPGAWMRFVLRIPLAGPPPASARADAPPR